MMNETDTQIRLRRAKEALAAAREAESRAITARSEAAETRRRAKERYDELFLREVQEEYTRRMANYRHATK
jgi:hypothetical protein